MTQRRCARSGRPLGVAVVGLAAAAAATGGAAALPWPAPGAPSWLAGVALLALAGVAGVVATSGVGRRLVGALLALAGVAAIVGAAGALGAPPAWLALAGALLLAGTGGFVAVREQALARFGARYARTDAPPADPDRAAWQALDEGRDPTADGAPVRRPDQPENRSEIGLV